MGYLHDYIDFVENKTFSELPFNEVDGIILAMLPMIDCQLAFPKKGKRSFYHCLARHVKVHELNQLGLIINSDISKMLYRCSKTKRYADCKIHSFSSIIDQTTETQATALCVDLDNGVSVVVFSGTDDTIVGWKEDFKMIYDHNVPCLAHSLNYLNKVGQYLEKFYIVGHSKGGMEAFYAYSFTSKSIQRKAVRVFSYDGPGLPKELVEQINPKITNKMKLLVPQGGIVGRMFYYPVEPTIIYSSYRGLHQHDPMSWEINRGRLHFHKVEEFNIQSNLLKSKLDTIISSLSEKQSREFVHYLFEVISAGGAYTLTDITKKPHNALIVFLKLPKGVRKMIGSLLMYLAKDKIIGKELLLGTFGINQNR